jgi:hypothetical protein
MPQPELRVEQHGGGLRRQFADDILFEFGQGRVEVNRRSEPAQCAAQRAAMIDSKDGENVAITRGLLKPPPFAK